MNGFWDAYTGKQWVEGFLVISVALFTLIVITLFILTVISRLKNIRKEKRKVIYAPVINQLLSAVLFEDKTYKDIKEEELYVKHLRKKLFRYQLLKSIVKLYKNYSGAYAEKLQNFYIESTLIRLSFQKLRNRRWYIKCFGINELSDMNIKKMYPVILELTKAKQNPLKIVALIAIINLKGMGALQILSYYEDHLNDWIQLNLLEAIKKSDRDDVPDFGYLLSAKNPSIIVLGLRLIAYFNQAQHLQTVHNFQQNMYSEYIKRQAKKTLEDLAILNRF